MVEDFLDGKSLNKNRKNKAAKDGFEVRKDIEKFASTGWEERAKQILS